MKAASAVANQLPAEPSHTCSGLWPRVRPPSSLLPARQARVPGSPQPLLLVRCAFTCPLPAWHLCPGCLPTSCGLWFRLPVTQGQLKPKTHGVDLEQQHFPTVMACVWDGMSLLGPPPRVRSLLVSRSLPLPSRHLLTDLQASAKPCSISSWPATLPAGSTAE